MSVDCEKVRVVDGSDYDFWDLCRAASIVFTSKNFPFIFSRGMSGKTLDTLEKKKINSTVQNLFDDDLLSSESSFEEYKRAHREMLESDFFTSCKFIVTTRGEKSVVVSDRESSREVPIDTIVSGDECVDSTGCGDVFIAAFLYAHVRRKKELLPCVDIAAKAAAAKMKR